MAKKLTMIVAVVMGCGGPPPATTGTFDGPPTPPAGAKFERMVGWYCPSMAGGRPGVWPWLVGARQSFYRDDAVAKSAVSHREVRVFSVLGWTGTRAGKFSVMGLSAGQTPVGSGSYTGADVCAESGTREQELNRACVEATEGCGLAVASMVVGTMRGSFFQDPEPIAVGLRAMCRNGNTVVVDVDGDGVTEAFQIPAVGQPAAPELVASSVSVNCEMSSRPVEIEGGYALATDLLGAGRAQLLFVRGSTLALYEARGTASRLELVDKTHIPVH